MKLMRLFENFYLEIMAAHSGTNQEVTTKKKVLGFDPKRSGPSKPRSQVHTVKDITGSFVLPRL